MEPRRLPSGMLDMMPDLDVSGASIKAFIDALPKDGISDSPIRVADVGVYKVGVYGVSRLPVPVTDPRP